MFVIGALIAGVPGVVAAQRDTSAAPPPHDTGSAAISFVNAAQAEAAGVKLLGVMDASTGNWIGRATVRDTLGNELVTSNIGVAALNLLQPVMGYYMLEVRKAGYSPQQIKLEVDTAAEFLVSLTPNPLGQATALPAVVTTERRMVLDRDAGARAGFFNRCSTGQVDCVGRKELDMHPTETIGVLVGGKKGVTCVYTPETPCHVRMRSALPDGPGTQYCDPTLFLNGMKWINGQGALERLVNPSVIDGIEVYLAGAPIPGRYYDPGGTKPKCGAVVIWTH
jgi:hypothetical protein